MDENFEEVIFKIISSAGNAKGLCYEALNRAEEGNFTAAYELLTEADDYLAIALNIQSTIIMEELNGEKIKISLLLMHAEDHLSIAMEARTLIERMVKLYGAMEKQID